MKDMLVTLSKKYPEIRGKLATVGLLISSKITIYQPFFSNLMTFTNQVFILIIIRIYNYFLEDLFP